jgi:hypothetical protein
MTFTPGYKSLSRMSFELPSRNNLELVENFRKMLGPFLEPERSSAAWPPNWVPVRYSPLPRLLDRQELDLIESVGGYGARLHRIRLYLKFASRIRTAIFEARRLALLNVGSLEQQEAALSFERILKRDKELAVCLFLIYAAVPMAALKMGNPSQLLEAVAQNLPNLLRISRAPIIPIKSLS